MRSAPIATVFMCRRCGSRSPFGVALSSAPGDTGNRGGAGRVMGMGDGWRP